MLRLYNFMEMNELQTFFTFVTGPLVKIIEYPWHKGSCQCRYLVSKSESCFYVVGLVQQHLNHSHSIPSIFRVLEANTFRFAHGIGLSVCLKRMWIPLSELTSAY